MPHLTVLLFRNSTNFAKVNTSEINQNACKNKHMQENNKISKIVKKEINYEKNDKFLIKKLQLFYIFRAKVSRCT